ncbi:hypothetical protein ABZP36_031283 [Zizania latifolia]
MALSKDWKYQKQARILLDDGHQPITEYLNSNEIYSRSMVRDADCLWTLMDCEEEDEDSAE